MQRFGGVQESGILGNDPPNVDLSGQRVSSVEDISHIRAYNRPLLFSPCVIHFSSRRPNAETHVHASMLPPGYCRDRGHVEKEKEEEKIRPVRP